MKQEFSIFKENERTANRYASSCLKIFALTIVMIWLLNAVGFFIVPKQLMNISIITATVTLLIPLLIVKFRDTYSSWIKYVIMVCTVIAMSILTATMTFHATIAISMPIIISCHYYNKKFITWTFIFTLVLTLIATYVGLYYGVYDENMLNLHSASDAFVDRIAVPRNIEYETLIKTFKFYYLPRAFILTAIFSVCLTLSNRTRRLVAKQDQLNRNKHLMDAELNVASKIQLSMLPDSSTMFGDRDDFSIYSYIKPAKEVSGDFYDFFLIDEENLGIIIADVSGKGIPASLFMMIAKTLIKSQLESGLSLKEMATKVNEKLVENNEEEMFVTAFMSVLNTKTGKLTYVNAGHNMPLLKRRDSEFEYLNNSNDFILAGMPDTEFHENYIQMKSGDKLFLYTDGVTEATDKLENLFGESRLKDILNKVNNLTVKDQVEAVDRAVIDFVNGEEQFDDITMLAVEFKG